jgi:acetyl esterase/lipase
MRRLALYAIMCLAVCFTGDTAAGQQPKKKAAGKRLISKLLAAAGAKVDRDILYGSDKKSHLVDLYVPKSDKTKPPLLVWIHGGGWRQGSKNRVYPPVLRLVRDGYAVASVEYRLNGLQAHPEHTHDCKGAIRWLRANAKKYGYDATRIGVAGGSAGGHLVLMLGMTAGVKELEGTVGGNLDQSSRVQAVVDLFGPADFTVIARKSARFRERYKQSMKFFESASPLTYLTKDDAPVLILQGTDDQLVLPIQSERLHKRYKELGLESTLHIIKGAGHSGPQFSDVERSKLVKAFFDKHIKQAAAK